MKKKDPENSGSEGVDDRGNRISKYVRLDATEIWF